MNPQGDDLLEFCRKLPKVELHAHISGSIRDASLRELLEQRRLKDPQFEADKAEEVINKESSRTIHECFTLFRVIQSLMTDLESVYEITRRVIADFAADGVRYLELRTTPRAIGSPACTKEEHVRTVLRAIRDGQTADSGPTAVRLLLSIDRSYGRESALETVHLAKAMSADPELGGFLVGIDLSGDPKKGAYEDYLPALKMAKSFGFPLALHLSEIPNTNDETCGLMSVLPDRIGHGTFLLPTDGGDQQTMELVLKNKIPLELCLTSNIKCQTVKEYSSHHLKFWLSQNHPLTVSTDDMGVFSCLLSEEFVLAAKTFDLHRRDLVSITRKAIDLAFCGEDTKAQLHAEFSKWTRENCPDLSLP